MFISSDMFNVGRHENYEINIPKRKTRISEVASDVGPMYAT